MVTLTLLSLRFRSGHRIVGGKIPGSYEKDSDEYAGMPWLNAGAQKTPRQSNNKGHAYKYADMGDNDIVIAVMGVTGAGKSTFIKTVSGRNDVAIGNTLSSGLPWKLFLHVRLPNDLLAETQTIHAYKFRHRNRNYVLVDTPGFDDTYRKDAEITEQILNWLKTSMLGGTQLNGIIYLHRISDTRMGGSALRNNRMFAKLCGRDALKNVVLATTFWSQVSPSVGANREKELRTNRDFWGGMLENNAKIARLGAGRASALAVLEEISVTEKVVLDAQDEMINQGRSVEETTVLKEERVAKEKLRKQFEAQKLVAKIELERKVELARQKAAARVARETEALREQREAERVAEDQRIVREENEAKERYVRQLREAREERQRVEERQKQELAALEQREAEEIAMLLIRELEALEAIVQQRREAQRNHICAGYGPKWPCDKCKGRIVTSAMEIDIITVEDVEITAEKLHTPT